MDKRSDPGGAWAGIKEGYTGGPGWVISVMRKAILIVLIPVRAVYIERWFHP